MSQAEFVCFVLGVMGVVVAWAIAEARSVENWRK